MKTKIIIALIVAITGCLNAFSQTEGEYKSVGYYNHPTSPRSISVNKILTKVNDSIYTTTVGDLNSGALKLNIHKNNTVTFENSSTSTGEGVIIPTADSINSFDPVQKKFILHYQFTLSTGVRYIREEMTRLLQFRQNEIDYVQISPTEVKLAKGDSCKGEIIIPSKVIYNSQEFKVTRIDNNAFLNNKSITNVILPLTINYIGERAFGWCGNLKSINIPDSVTFIGDYAFSTTDISSIFLPKNTIDIGFHLFYQCRYLTAINVSADNPNSKSVDGVLFSKSGYYLFEYPNGKQDKSYIIPEGTVKVYDQAFDGLNSYLQDLIIPEGVINCGRWAFMNLQSLKSIKIPSTLKSFNGALTSSSELEAIEVSALNPYLRSVNGIIFNSKLDSLIKCPAKLNGMSTYYIPNTVKYIESMAFKDCDGLVTLSIPASVKSIGSIAFANCQNLKTVYSYSATPINIKGTGISEIGKNNATLYVPIGAKGLYEVANEWKDFASIIEITTSITEQKEPDFKIFPNPSTQYIEISAQKGISKVEICNLTGETIETITLKYGQHKLDISALPKGVYLAKVYIENTLSIEKFIKK